MAVEYRRLRADEVDAAADLWVQEHQDPNPAGAQHQAWRRQFCTLPDLLSHTWVAVADDGSLLSISRYLRVWIHAADGVPQRVARVSHVFTRASARRRGHATRLLELMLAAMEADGCLWSILSASEEGQPLYARYGWRPLPLRKVSRHQIENVDWWRSTGSAEFLVATATSDEQRPSAYALVYGWPGQGWLLLEIGALTGRQDALIALLAAITQRPGVPNTSCRLWLPRDFTLEAALTQRLDL